MRKTISLVLVAAMLVAMFAFAPASSAATLDANNVLIEAQYFGGTTMYSEISGTNQDGFIWNDAYEIKAGDENQGILTIDGIIEEGEWTEVVYHIDSDYAPQSGLAYGNNSLFEVPSAENTFYRWLKDGNNQSLAPADGLEYDVRFMWDDKFFYMAVEYTDTDGYINSGTATAGSNWDGDSIQFRLDPYGPNAVVGGQGYNAAVDSFPYDPEIHGETDTTLNCTYPWANFDTTYSSFGEETHSTIGNFIFSYYTSGYTDMCDASKRYFPTEVEVEVELEDGTIGTKMETQWKPADISEWGDLALETDKYITYATVYPHDIDPRPAFVKDSVVYEIALPWALVADDYAPAANNELGFSMARFNATLGKGPYNSYLSWGSGLTNYDTQDMPQTCGGSNCLVLSDVNANDTAAHEHVFAEATCEVPEACECGYKRGFVSGHKNAYSGEVLPTESSDGHISAECTVCGTTFEMTIDSSDVHVRYDFLQDEASIHDQGWYPEGGFCIQWETLDENGSRYTSETDPTGTLKQLIWNEDGTAKNSYNTEKFGYAVADLTIDGQTGTYFESQSYSKSYTETMDVYFDNLPLTSEVDSETPYNTFFGNWFGGDGTYGGNNGVYALAGLVNVEDQWFFAIYPSSHQNPQSIEELDECAYSYTPATAEQIATGVWHDYAFMFDSNAETAMLFWDGELVASATDYHFPSTNDHAILLIHNVQSYVKNIEIGSTSLAAERTGWTGNEEIEPDVIKGDLDGDGQINGIDSNYLMRAVAGTLSIESGSNQEKAADVNGDGAINAIDTNMLKRILAGA